MKRHFVMAAGMAVMSAVFALSGCGGNGSAGKEEASDSTNEESKEIIFWNTGTGDADKLI